LQTFPSIKTENYLLRQITDTDLENIFLGLSNPEVIKYYGISYSTLEETKEQLKFYRDLEMNSTGIWWAICSLNNEEFYGAIGFNNRNLIHHNTEIGYWLLPQFWGKGIVKNVLPMVCNFAFNELQLHRIVAMIESENIASRKTVEQFGFNYEGTMKQCEFKDGRWIDLEIFAIIKTDL
jgi:ribosomal-protein-alanine N-acetyltransferase